MPITIGSNVLSVGAQRQLERSTTNLSQTLERLSSGQRINRASDDAASLSIAATLELKTRVITQAIRNANDGISSISIADGALAQLSDVITRIIELAEQAANGTYSSSQRQALDTEAQTLAEEYQRIVDSVDFNKLKLLDGSVSSIDLQVGLNGSDSARISLELESMATRSVGDGTFESELLLNTGGTTNSLAVVTGDFNNDGKIDFARSLQNGGAPNLRVALGNGDGTFALASGISTTPVVLMVAGDFNNDGKLDIMGTDSNNNQLVFYEGKGDGTFNAGVAYAAGSAPGIADIADLNGDGDLDLVVGSSTTSYLNVLLGNGNGTFEAPVSYDISVTNASRSQLADVNGDEILDVVTTTSSSIFVSLGVGNGTFGAAATVANQINSYQTSAVGDVNGDGFIDVVALGNTENTLDVFLGNGNATFKARISYAIADPGTNPNVIKLDDINSDGYMDAVATSNASGLINVLLGKADGTFGSASTYTVTVNPRSIALGDFNGDGGVDIVAATTSTGQNSIYFANTHLTSGLAPFSLLNRSEALSALGSMRTVLDSLASSRGGLGATQRRLEIAINNIFVMGENQKAARSRIVSADVAVEAANLQRFEILQESAMAVLAQANQQPALALQLLSS